ncbi:unnamed protein product [Phytophthora fragariaefolia]|uniref:Unnamed protein product n=1 Tax=Phytophthora fragariaefolia TaxID=1490495 RepID=A0A9W6TPF1_9STRA|nr:unnamed protein product [Phytophthora fragariaefolia]
MKSGSTHLRCYVGLLVHIGFLHVLQAGTFDFDAQDYTFPENSSTVQVKIVRTGGTSGSVVVKYALARPMDATATVNKNFKLIDSVYEVKFDENQLEGNIGIELINDGIYEANEYFYLEISSVTSPAKIGPNHLVAVFIADDGDAGQFNFAVPFIFCREDSGNADVLIERSIGFSSASYVPVTLVVSTVTVDGNATSGGSKAFDYLSASQQLSWATDEIKKTFSVKIFNNNKYQSKSRSIKVRLDSVEGGASIGKLPEMWIYIIDDRDAGTLSFELSHYEVMENAKKVTVNVTRSGILDSTNVNTYTDGAVEVDIATYSGTIVPGKFKYDLEYDYGVVEARGCTHISPCTADASVAYAPLQTTRLQFSDKEASKTVDIVILNNDLFQAPDQVFKVILKNVGGGAHLGVDYEHPVEWSWYHDNFLALETHSDQLLDNVGTIVTISDDGDAAVIVSKASLSVSEIGQIDNFRVRLNSQPASDVTVQLGASAADLKIDLPSLTFSSANWNQYQTVTVEAVPNDIADSIHSSIISISASSDDTFYNSPLKTKAASSGYTLALGIYTQKWGTYDTGNIEQAFPWDDNDGVLTSPSLHSSIKAFIIDDDQPILSIVPEDVRYQETSVPRGVVCVRENGHDASVEIALLSEPRANVAISLVVDGDSRIHVDPEVIHVTPSTWKNHQYIKISASTASSTLASNEVTYSKVLFYSTSTGDALYDQGNKPAGMVFVQRYPAAVVLLNSARATTQENGGDKATVGYDIQLGSEPMHWQPQEGKYKPFELTHLPNADTTLFFSTKSQGPFGSSTTLTTASNSSLSTTTESIKSVALVRFDTYPLIQTKTGSSQVGQAIFRLYRLSGGENRGLGGIVAGVTAANMDTSDTWSEASLQTQCTVHNAKVIPECSLVENGLSVPSLFPSLTTFVDVSAQTDGETLVKQSRKVDSDTNQFVPSSGWIEIDVTAAVNRVLSQQRDSSSGHHTISFLVYSRSIATFLYDDVDEIIFASKEYSNADFQPQLQILASGSVNLALSGTVSQSQQGKASAAIDGETISNTGVASSYAMSRAVDAYPWWQIDLNSIRRIEDIVITIKKKVPATDLEEPQLAAVFWVFLSDKPFPMSNNETEDFLSTKAVSLYSCQFRVLSRSFDASETEIITYRWRINGEMNGNYGEDRFVADYTTPTEAQYLRLQIQGENSILLNEVEIYQQAFASTRISIGGYMPSAAHALNQQNQIEFSLSAMQDTEDPLPCDNTTRICRHELLFTSGTWRTAQQVQVTAVDDHVAIGDRDVMVTHTAESLDPDYAGDSFCEGSCNGHLFNDSSVKPLLIQEDDENKVILSKSKVDVIEGSNAYPTATSFYKPSVVLPRYIRCSNDPALLIDVQTSPDKYCAPSFTGASAKPWETCVTNTSALPLESGSAWMMAGFESATNLSTMSMIVPSLTGTKYIRQITLWGNFKRSITSVSDSILNISKDWNKMATVKVPMKSGPPQTVKMSGLSDFTVQSVLLVFDSSFDAINDCVLAPKVSMTGYKPIPFPLSLRGDLSNPNSVPPERSHLSRMHLYGVSDSVLIKLSSEPLADVLISVRAEAASAFIATFGAANNSNTSDLLIDLIGANYESGDIRQYRMPAALRFNAENWNVSQKLTFMAVDDNTYLGDRTLVMHMISYSTDIKGNVIPFQSIGDSAVVRYETLLSSTLSYSSAEFIVSDHQDSVWPFHNVAAWRSVSGSIEIAVVDDDLPGVTISASDVVASESCLESNFSVSLDSAPLQDVNIKISYEMDLTLFSASPLEMTFTRLNWYMPQVIHIYPVANVINDGAFPFTLNYERLIPKAKQPILLHTVISTDDWYNGLKVGTNENDSSVLYVVNQGSRIIIEDDDTGCDKEYDCLNGGECLHKSSGNVCWCPPTFGMKNCSLICERESECAFDRVLFNIRCYEGELQPACGSTFSAKVLTAELYRMLTTKPFTGLDGEVHPKLSLDLISEAMYVVNNSRATCVDGSEECISVSIDFKRPDLDDTSITSKLFAYQEAGSLKSSPMHIELMTADPQYLKSSSATIGMWIFVGFCGAALTGAGGLFAARAIHAKTSHVVPDNDFPGEQTELLAVGATSPNRGGGICSSTLSTT